MLLRLAMMGISNLFILGLTGFLFRCLRTKTFHLDLPIFGFLWIFNATLFTFLFGVFGILKPTVMAVVCLIGLSVMAVHAYRHQSHYAATLDTFFSRLKGLRFTVVSGLLVAAALLQLGRVAFHVWYIPPYVHDTLTYHLPNVAEWVQKERIHAISTPVIRSNWPAAFEVLETWFVVFLHHDLLIQLACVACYLLAVVSVFAICRGLGMGTHLAAGVALLFAYTPSVAIHATSCKNDLAVAAFYLFSMAILVDLWRNGDNAAFPLNRRFLLLAMAFAFGVGTKAYTVFIAPGIIVLGILALFKHRLFKVAIHALRPSSILSARQLLLYTSLLLASGVLALYWYVRNYVVFDNPFYPADFRLFGHLIFGTGNPPNPGISAQPSFSFHSMWANTRNLVTFKIFDQLRYYADLHRITGWGWFSFACGISSVIYGALFDRRVRSLIFCFVLSLLSLLGWIFVDDWHGRFLHFFPPIFAIAFGATLMHLATRWVWVSLSVLAAICSLLNFVAVLNVGVFAKEDLKHLMETPPLKRSAADRSIPWSGGGLFQQIHNRVPKDEVIGYNAGKNHVIYPLYGSDLSHRLRYLPDSIDNVTEFMKSQKIHYLYAAGSGGRGVWEYPYGGHQIGIRNGRMATWINIQSVNREYDSGVISAHEWTHLAFTFSGREAVSYVNGEIVAKHTDRRGKIEFKENPNFVIGDRSNVAPGEPFKGLVDEVALFNRVLSQQEILTAMKHGASLAEPVHVESSATLANANGLVAYYRFDKGTRDLSGKGHDGKLVGVVELIPDEGAPVPNGNGCVRFSGRTGNAVDCGKSSDLRIARNLTLMAWVKPDAVGPTQFVAGPAYAGGKWYRSLDIATAIREGNLIEITEHLYALKSTEANRRVNNSNN